jgi:hypothetical protein
VSVAFRFDAGAHEYIEVGTGALLPHITGMLHATGWVDDTWFTEESSLRGQAVHRLTAEYDLGALDIESCTSRYRAYLLGHVKLMGIVRPKWNAIEEPIVHPTFKFGGRPDRDGLVFSPGLNAVWEVKAAIPQRSHQVQTALQAILVAPKLGLPPFAVKRFAEYLKPNGKFKVEEHKDARDFREAERVIRRCCT